MPEELIRALGAIKRAAALVGTCSVDGVQGRGRSRSMRQAVNTRAGQLDPAIGSAIAEAAAEVRLPARGRALCDKQWQRAITPQKHGCAKHFMSCVYAYAGAQDANMHTRFTLTAH
ncbi:hypothetical protein HaLaN_16835 [Haematococcus lacustris]|uniref:Uncharacterized protein n=1 Tax=Haematococcus lacustris TaxID=44745 RepID=A0A699ZLL1_HAELA|nr:hypothetical protein HaLaN_16835 [Haematococcus lacustris]